MARRELVSETIHDTAQYVNNSAELSHEPTRVRGRGMRRFKPAGQAQGCLAAHAAVCNLFNLARYLASAETYRYFQRHALRRGKKLWQCRGN